MANKDEQGRWLDGAGNAIPPKFIDPVDKKRDAMVEKLFKQAVRMSENMRSFKQACYQEIHCYLDWLAEQHGEESLNPGGNYKLTTFFGDKQVSIKVNKVIEFDERLQLAKQKIDRCLETWSDGANDNLKVVVFDAFKVDKKGNVDTKRILSLRRLKIKDPLWKEAMELISDAITSVGTRQYLMFLNRENNQAEWKAIRLDLAGV